MRLTLRTLLAYLDEMLDADDAQDVAQRIEDSDVAQEVMRRRREVMHKLALGAPAPLGDGLGLDPNTVAEYIDNTLPAEHVPDFERVCLDSDEHLAETAACHQILSLVVGGPVDVDHRQRRRLYSLIDQASAPASAPTEPEKTAPVFVERAPAPLPAPEESPFTERTTPKLELAVVAACIALGFVYWLASNRWAVVETPVAAGEESGASQSLLENRNEPTAFLGDSSWPAASHEPHRAVVPAPPSSRSAPEEDVNPFTPTKPELDAASAAPHAPFEAERSAQDVLPPSLADSRGDLDPVDPIAAAAERLFAESPGEVEPAEPVVAPNDAFADAHASAGSASPLDESRPSQEEAPPAAAMASAEAPPPTPPSTGAESTTPSVVSNEVWVEEEWPTDAWNETLEEGAPPEDSSLAGEVVDLFPEEPRTVGPEPPARAVAVNPFELFPTPTPVADAAPEIVSEATVTESDSLASNRSLDPAPPEVVLIPDAPAFTQIPAPPLRVIDSDLLLIQEGDRVSRFSTDSALNWTREQKLIAAAGFQPAIAWNGVTLHLASGAAVRLDWDAVAGEAIVTVVAGECLLEGKQAGSIRIEAGDATPRVAWTGAVRVRLTAQPRLVLGEDPRLHAEAVAYEIAASPEAQVSTGSTERKIAAGQAVRFEGESGPRIVAATPPSIVAVRRNAYQQKLANSFVKQVEAADDPRAALEAFARDAEAGSLARDAIVTAVACGHYELAWRGLDDPRLARVADVLIHSLQQAAASSPAAAEQVAAAAVSAFGRPAPSADPFRLLIGYRTDQWTAGAAGALVQTLEHPALVHRTLAIWNLREATGATYGFDPQGQLAGRRRSVKTWQDKLRHNQLEASAAVRAPHLIR